MTLFGILWIILLILCFSKIENMIVLCIVSSTIQCSNVLVLGEIGIGPQIITSIVFTLRILLKKKVRKKYDRQDWGLIKCSFLVFGAALFSSAYNKNIDNSAIRLVQLFIYIICGMEMYYAAERIDQNDIYQLIRKLTIAMMILGFAQVLFSSGMLPKFPLFDQLFFNDTRKYVYYYTPGGYRRILGTYMEPSYYAAFVVGAFYYFLSLKSRRQENWGIIAVLGLQIILTFSSSAYGAFVIVGFLYILISKERKFKFGILLLAILAFLGFYMFFYDILDQVIFSKLSMVNASYRVRHGADIQSFRAFKSSPIIGNGYKTQRASSIIYTLLGEMGIVGLFSYIILNGNIIIHNLLPKLKRTVSEYELALSLSILSAVAVQILAVPDLDICTYWMWMNLMMLQLAVSARRERIK